MSVLSSTGSPGRDASTAAPRPGEHPDRPARADGVELLGELPGSGYRVPPALARRADGQTVQLTRLLYLVLQAVDGRRSYAEIAEHVSPAFGRLVSADNVRVLVERQLRPLGLLRLADGTQPSVRKADPLLGLRFRCVVSDPEVTRRITTPFARLFHPLVVVAVVVAFVAVAGWVLFEKGLASAAHEAFDRPGLLLLIFAITVVSAGFHEFGHAAAARYGGATPGAMGAALYLVWPAFYTDVTDSYRLGRGGRLRTDLGGLYFNAIVAVAMFGVWWVTGWDALLLIIATQVLQMVRQLAPLVRFDGYHVLADLTGVPDLYHRIGPTLRSLLPGRWRSPEASVLKPWARAVVTIWVVVVVPLLLLCLVLMVAVLPRLVGTALASIGRQWTMLGDAAAAGDLAGVLVRVLSVVAIALPVLGVVYLLVRTTRRAAAAVWRATGGRPARRAVAAVGAAAAIVALALAWWPDPDRYRPIQPYERGTVADVVPAVLRTPLGLPGGTGQGLREGGQVTARTVWPAGTGALPTRDQPALAVVLVPRPGSGNDDDPTWVFPFDRPLPPGEGDNQALAVNTTDGSTVYDVAFALVWVTADAVADNRNEAYALASCRNCTTVAVAFQVVLVVGHAAVAPENVAAAVNYSCAECLTYALASQLVVTLPGELSADGRAELASVWARLQEFGRTIQGVPLDRLYVELERFKSEILEIVQREALVTQPTQTTQTGQPPATSTGTAPGTEPAAPGEPTQPPATQPPATSGEPTEPAPTQQPTPEPTTTEPAPTTAPPPPTGTGTTAPGESTPAVA